MIDSEPNPLAPSGRARPPPRLHLRLPLQDFSKNPTLDLFPGGETAAELEALNTAVVYEGVNNAVYKCGTTAP